MIPIIGMITICVLLLKLDPLSDHREELEKKKFLE